MFGNAADKLSKPVSDTFAVERGERGREIKIITNGLTMPPYKLIYAFLQRVALLSVQALLVNVVTP